MNIEINNYKSIIKTKVEIKEGLNILIGPNGAGKTNVLSSLKFLKDIILKGAGLAVAKAGGPSRVYNSNSRTLKFIISENIEQKTINRRRTDFQIKWTIQLAQKGEEKIAAITKESVSLIGMINNKSVKAFNIDINRSNISKPKYQIFFNDKLDLGRNLLDKYEDDHKNLKKSKLFEKLRTDLQTPLNHLKKDKDRSLIILISFYDKNFGEFLFKFLRMNEFNIIPEQARKASEQLPYARMQSNGYGISEVIDALIKKSFRKVELSHSFDIDTELPLFFISQFLSRIMRIGRFRGDKRKNPLEDALTNIREKISAAVQPISDIGVEIDPTNGKRFVIFKTDNEKFYPDQVSDGTIKWLCILASIYVDSSSVYLLEEPENFLHPWMQQKLVEIMREQSKLHNSIFLLTSHSSTVLNACYPEEIITVEATEKGTIADKIKNRSEVDEFLNNSNFRLGDLWVSGGLGAIPQ